jgi:hypothetical protein
MKTSAKPIVRFCVMLGVLIVALQFACPLHAAADRPDATAAASPARDSAKAPVIRRPPPDLPPVPTAEALTLPEPLEKRYTALFQRAPPGFEHAKVSGLTAEDRSPRAGEALPRTQRPESIARTLAIFRSPLTPFVVAIAEVLAIGVLLGWMAWRMVGGKT